VEFFELMRFAESEAKKMGGNFMVQHTSQKNDVGPLFEHLGYVETDKYYVKKIEEG